MDLTARLTESFGFPAFRPGQREASTAALAGRDTLVVMPTGSGKSLCYQLPALLRDDLTVVVSPLVSLMTDQVQALERVAPGRVGLVNAQRDAAANRAVLERAVGGQLRLLYLAPERFSSPGFVERLHATGVGLFVVDEAHCVSQWGHDFRPDYFRLADAARYLGASAIVASTATATPRVAADIVARLGLRDPVRVTTGFDRPSLSFAVARCRTAADKERRLVAALREPGALPAIVYAGTRAAAESTAAALAGALSCEAVVYHAGLARDERADAQRRFMAGEVPVVVATNAFGMGVDKADVRTVVHVSVPSSVEAWYQEAGRAGRDGAPARALLLAEARDKGLHVFFIERARIDDAAFAAIAGAIGRGADARGRYDLETAALARAGGGDPREGAGGDRVRAIVGHLARVGVLQPTPAPMDRTAGRLVAALDARALTAARSAGRAAEQARWQEYRAVWALVEGSACRRETILRHFGDRSRPAPTVPCCDVCDPTLVPQPISVRAARGDAGGSDPVPEDLDTAILELVSSARPAVGRTRAVQILRGGRGKDIERHSYDGLPAYGAFAHLTGPEVLRRVDELLGVGRLRSTGGRFPKLARA